MFRTVVLSFALAFPAAALACPGEDMAKADAPKVELASVQVDATECAKKADLVGSNCRYSTGMMAQRVQAEGQDTALTAKLERSDKALESHVAAPFVAPGGLHVIANTVIENVDLASKLALTGKVLEVDGVKYFLVTSVQKSST